ncbi:Hypothetical predicted protein [Lecanosticta acicola]|uniref:Uncharacterized protein n=1 Tax=Lecanosticta acicola TaxID=111012 RepID=A0AAI9E8P1_9PEZI|nr:Hypothetical predicted protein [Lecanosticta acicola]
MSSPESTPERRRLLNDEESPLPTPTPAVSTPSPHLLARHRPGYARVPSVSFNDDALATDITDSPAQDEIEPAPRSSSDATSARHGLGIAMPATPAKSRRFSSPLSQSTSSAYAKPATDERTLTSPPSTGGMSGSTRFDASFDADTSYAGASRLHKDSRTSFQSGATPSIYAKSDAGLLSIRERYDDFAPHQHCQSKRSVRTARLGSWVSWTVLVLAVFSTAFSGIFLVIALTSPNWGRSIRNTGGKLTPGSAAFLTSLFAKLIELSFVTVVVAFIGQALARRAFTLENPRGITLAEMSMRTWILQPGTMFTQPESVKYAGISFLGIVSLLAALLAVLYTSASTALVQPQLRYPNWKPQPLQGLVKTQYANSDYIESNCKTPIQNGYDRILPDGSDPRLSSCMQIEHAAMAFHNYHTWLSRWTDVAENGSDNRLLEQRPPGYALYNDNTTITAPWISMEETRNSTEYIVNNVTMAMPHIGVIQAREDPINALMQPDDIDGAVFSLKASVPSPTVNVLCVTMKYDDLKPFVYEFWNASGYPPLNISGWPHNYGYTNPYLNGTKFDHIFGWGPEYGAMNYPPVFAKVPQDYNTLVNDTTGVPWGRRTIYLLGKGGPIDSTQSPTTGPDGKGTNYAICQLQAGQTANCSTHYNASISGATMEAVCDNEHDKLQYQKRNPQAWTGNETLNQDWPNIAGEWARSLSLNAGLTDGNASNARILTQFILTANELNSGLPSLAEALAVLAGCTLIESVIDSPFVGKKWNYTLPTVDGQHQYFNASVRDQQYASGGKLPYQKAFHLVLFAVFTINVFVLVYFLIHKDWYSDFTDPNNMFALAVNSPPSEKLAGSCGCGPSGEQYRVSWKLNNDEGHVYVESHDNPHEVTIDSPRMSRRRWTETFELTPPLHSLKKRFSGGSGT